MSVDSDILRNLVGLKDWDHFNEFCWEKQVFFSRSFQRLGDRDVDVSAADVLDCLRYQAFRFGDLWITTTHGRKAPVRLHQGSGKPYLREVAAAYESGASIVFSKLECRMPVLGKFCQMLSRELQSQVSVNGYLTPAGATGFARHMDSHDVLILQVSGSKHWRLYEQIMKNPTPNQVAGDCKQTPELRSMVIEQGNLLYIPAGFPHQAYCSESPSLHLTVGIYKQSVGDLLIAHLSEMIESNERLREPLNSSSIVTGDKIKTAEAIHLLNTYWNDVGEEKGLAKLRSKSNFARSEEEALDLISLPS